jgi:hypothetical protein
MDANSTKKTGLEPPLRRKTVKLHPIKSGAGSAAGNIDMTGASTTSEGKPTAMLTPASYTQSNAVSESTSIEKSDSSALNQTASPKNELGILDRFLPGRKRVSSESAGKVYPV